jgi:hypothetical protein
MLTVISSLLIISSFAYYTFFLEAEMRKFKAEVKLQISSNFNSRG